MKKIICLLLIIIFTILSMSMIISGCDNISISDSSSKLPTKDIIQQIPNDTTAHDNTQCSEETDSSSAMNIIKPSQLVSLEDIKSTVSDNMEYLIIDDEQQIDIPVTGIDNVTSTYIGDDFIIRINVQFNRYLSSGGYPIIEETENKAFITYGHYITGHINTTDDNYENTYIRITLIDQVGYITKTLADTIGQQERERDKTDIITMLCKLAWERYRALSINSTTSTNSLPKLEPDVIPLSYEEYFSKERRANLSEKGYLATSNHTISDAYLEIRKYTNSQCIGVTNDSKKIVLMNMYGEKIDVIFEQEIGIKYWYICDELIYCITNDEYIYRIYIPTMTADIGRHLIGESYTITPISNYEATIGIINPNYENYLRETKDDSGIGMYIYYYYNFKTGTTEQRVDSPLIIIPMK